MPSMLHLTPVHFSVYEFILKYKIRHDGVSPSFLEISKACEISSTSQVRIYLDSLMLFGMIQCDYSNGRSRMISIPGGRWTPPLNGVFSSSPSLKQGEHGAKVSGSSHKS